MRTLSIDFETRSPVDLPKCGAHVYFEHPDAKVLCAAYAFDDGPVKAWHPFGGERTIPEIDEHVRAGGPISAWNAAFERLAWRTLTRDLGWAEPRLEQFHDTAAWGAAMSLPRSLDGAAKALGLDVVKDKGGRRLIAKFSMPNRKGGWNEPADHVDDFLDFVRYCQQDVLVERAVRQRLVSLGTTEREVYLLDQRINDRGVQLDTALIEALMALTDKAKLALDKRLAEASGFAVMSTTAVSQLGAFLRERGVPVSTLGKAALKDWLACDDLPDDAREVLEIRKEAAKSSTAKLAAMRKCAGADEKVRGLLLYHGAGTGRWTGRLVQPQNFPRGGEVIKDTEEAARALLGGDTGPFDGRPMTAVSDMLRACITASPDRRLVAADYSSIEGRGTAWLAGEEWKLRAFEANDRGEGHGIYELTAGEIFDKDPAKIGKGDERQVGKVAELALGFQGGVMAFDAMARVYGLDMAVAYGPLMATTDPETVERAKQRYAECLERKDSGTDLLSPEQWLASEITKVRWREKHPATRALWRGLEDAAIEAVLKPGSVQRYTHVAYTVAGGFLWCRLPSGRCLAYGAPKLKMKKTPWGDEVMGLTAMNVDSVTKQWARRSLYGGLLCENCLSGSSEVLTDMGWRNILTVDCNHRLWDGQSWVAHDGVVWKGRRETMDLGGLRLTPDHQVLANDKWGAADEISVPEAASQGRAAYRRAVWSLGRRAVRRLGWAEIAMAAALRLRGGACSRRDGAAEKQAEKLRVPSARNGRGADAATRHVPAPGVRSVEQHARAVPEPEAQAIRQLRRARHSSRSVVGAVRELLAGYGARLCQWVVAGSDRQRLRLWPHELPLDGPKHPSQEHTAKPRDRHAERADAALRRSGGLGARQDNAGVSGVGGVAGGPNVRPAVADQPAVEAVFDILNAGPRRRFLARGPGGEPFIVHNCVQALCRDVMVHGMRNADAAGYPIVLTVHDEVVADTPLGHGSVGEFEALLCQTPEWAEGLPVSAEGWEGHRYRK